jgi:hypothetical protein
MIAGTVGDELAVVVMDCGKTLLQEILEGEDRD